MPAQIIDGRKISSRIQAGLISSVRSLKEQTRGVPKLVNLIATGSPGSLAYANAQQRCAEQVGIDYQLIRFDNGADEAVLISQIEACNADPEVTGIMLHKPLPPGCDYQRLVRAILPVKDVEGLHPQNMGQLFSGEPRFIPCTPAAVMECLTASGVTLYGKEAVVVGASEIVGQPLSLLLLQRMATVTVCHIATTEAGRLPEHVARADVLIVAVGCPEVIKGAWVKTGAVVVDVGINNRDGKIVGDVEYEPARQRAAYITPVPGGVGPVTVMMLMRNGLQAYIQQKRIPDSKIV